MTPATPISSRKTSRDSELGALTTAASPDFLRTPRASAAPHDTLYFSLAADDDFTEISQNNLDDFNANDGNSVSPLQDDQSLSTSHQSQLEIDARSG